MDTSLVLHLARRVLEISLLLSGPSLVVTLVVGFVTGIIQAVTSVRDMSMGMVVKLAAVGVTLLATGGWMISTAGDFVMEIFNHMQAMGH
jgi:flagellar biosynthetic protein FliQ